MLALAANGMAAGRPWKNHAAPFDFLFGNSIDTHQQTKVNKGKLQGFFYIDFIEPPVLTDGLATAEHGSETAGWKLKGVPLRAKLIANDGGEHPTWCVDPDDIPKEIGYTHFHWVGEDERSDLVVGQEYDGYLLKLTAIDTFFFIHSGGFAITPGIDFYSHDNIITDCE